jgi:ABC-type lipoprotein release transport system permease subunit
VLGIVIGITAIVGMTSIIKGFDQSMRDRSHNRPEIIFMSDSATPTSLTGAKSASC